MQTDLTFSPGHVALQGELTARQLGPLWARAMAVSAQASSSKLTIDLSAVSRLDSSGAAMVLAMERQHGGDVALTGASDRDLALLAQLRDTLPSPDAPAKASPKAAGTRAKGSLLRSTSAPASKVQNNISFAPHANTPTGQDIKTAACAMPNGQTYALSRFIQTKTCNIPA